jgi:putative addiction module killer protein
MKDIRIYKDPAGKEPFTVWLNKLKDKITKARIRRRIDRLSQGNEGDFKAVGLGVFELRLDFGPGYRVYYGKAGKVIVVLLCGGTKRSQDKDIERAKKYWTELEKGDLNE